MPSPTSDLGARIAPIMTGCLIANARILEGTGRARPSPARCAWRAPAQDRAALLMITKDGALHRAP
jgi:hypothetical protein